MSKLVRYTSVPTVYEGERGIARPETTAVGTPVTVVPELTVIPPGRQLFVPRLITSHTKLKNAAVAMRHLSMSTEEATRTDRFELSCLRLSFDGSETLFVEGANRAEHGVVRLKAKPREPSPSWSVLVPAEPVRSILSGMANRPIEIAPGERMHFGPLSVQIVQGDFPDAPIAPPDVNEGEAKTVSFQSIISRAGLDSATRFCTPVINPTGQANLQYLILSPGLKQIAASDSRQARLMRLDIRSKPRLEHPQPFSLTPSAARAAVVMEESEFVFLSLLETGELIVGGRNDQSYLIEMSPRVQSGTPNAIFDILPSEGNSSFTVSRAQVVEFCRQAMTLLIDGDMTVSIFFGEAMFRMQAVLRGDNIERGDIDWELRLLATTQTAEIKDRTMHFDVEQVLNAVQATDGEQVTFLLSRRATRRDAIAVVGEDTTKVSIISPVVGDHDEREED